MARTLLASGKVRWVGEPIAAILAETYEQATDAAQAVVADIDPLPTLIDLEEALTSETHVYEAAGGNAAKLARPAGYVPPDQFGGKPPTASMPNQGEIVRENPYTPTARFADRSPGELPLDLTPPGGGGGGGPPGEYDPFGGPMVGPRSVRSSQLPTPSSGLQTGDGQRLNRPCVFTRIA